MDCHSCVRWALLLVTLVQLLEAASGALVEKIINGHQVELGASCEGNDPLCGPRTVAQKYSFFASLRASWGQRNAYCGASLIHPQV